MARRGRANSSFRRGTPYRQTKPIVLIVCEGNKTEKEYFEEYKRAHRLTAVRVKVIKGKRGGNDPRSLIETAGKHLNNPVVGDEKADIAWCVFDHDGRPNMDQVIQKAEEQNINTALSVPCFELYLLLHFQDQTAHLSTQQAQDALKAHIPDYDKGVCRFFTDLTGKEDACYERCRKLRVKHQGDGNPQNTNPSSDVDKLIAFLKGEDPPN